MEVDLNSHGAGGFDILPAALTAVLPRSSTVHHQFTPQFTLGALRTPGSDATLQRDWGSNLHRKHSRLELASKNCGGTMKSSISLFLLTLALAASSTLMAPCQRLQQFHHPRHLRFYHPRNNLPPGR